MTAEQWFGLSLVLILGAMSPGPSVAVVIRNTMIGGKRMGVATGIGHGIGFGVYAFSTAAGLSIALSAHPATENALRWGGTLLLIYLGFVFLKNARVGARDEFKSEPSNHAGKAGFVQGFLIALFNPKILAWMMAIYAPFVEPGADTQTLIGMGALGLLIDGTWYVGVATVLSDTGAIDKLRARAHLIDGAMAVLMFCFAALLASGVL
ncbi:MAG: LysE family translocator [Akkermansiaceae bacterium]